MRRTAHTATGLALLLGLLTVTPDNVAGPAHKNEGARATQQKRASVALSAEELFKKVSPSVFVVVALDASKHPVELGSAVVIADGILETNYHVIEAGVSFEVRQGTKSWPATLVATNPDHDIAELRVDKLGGPAVPMRRFDSLAVGENVYAIGAPEGLELTLSQGLISSLRQSGGDRIIQTTAAISPGSSGGGLFDATGQLVGITVAYVKGGQNLNFALPTDWISSARSASEWYGLGSKAYRQGQEKQKSDNLDTMLESFGFYENAANDYREALRIDSQSDESWIGLGDALLTECLPSSPVGERCVDAMSAYQRAIRLRPDDSQAWEGVARADEWRLGGEPDEEKALRNALRIDPTDVKAWEDLAEAYIRARKFDDALTALDTARTLIKQGDEARWRDLGGGYGSLAEDGKYANAENLQRRAIDYEQRAIRLRPSDRLAWEFLGQVYVDMKDRAGLMKAYEEIKTLDPKEADYFFEQYVLPRQQSPSQ